MIKPISMNLPLPSTPAVPSPRLTPPVVPPTNPSGEQEEDGFKEHAILLRSKRQEMLASNIANVDTPHYQAKDLDFRTSLRNAVNNQRSEGTDPSDLRKTAAGHLSQLPQPSGSIFNSTVALVYRVPLQTSLDSNTVDMDVERGQIADNAIRYQLALQAYEDEYKEFRQASMTGGTR